METLECYFAEINPNHSPCSNYVALKRDVIESKENTYMFWTKKLKVIASIKLNYCFNYNSLLEVGLNLNFRFGLGL